MENVIELHKADLAAGTAKLHSLTPQSNEWWEVKERLKKYEIAFSQAANIAGEHTNAGITGEFLEYHLEFYKHLTAPYRPEKKLPKGITNIDDEIELGKDAVQ